jgi:hypothetical protein
MISFGFTPMRWFLLCLLLFTSGAGVLAAAESGDPGDTGSAWRDAMTAYRAGSFERALEGFKKIAEEDKEISAALCHNIANAEYKLGNDTAASIWYRRAVALDPFLAEARQNLRFIHRKMGFLRFENDGRGGKSGFFRLIRDGLVSLGVMFPRRYWMTACLAAVWATAILTVWLVWIHPRPGRRWPLVTLLCLSAAFLTVTLCGLSGKALNTAPSLAQRLISLPDEAQARTAPAEAAGSVISLPGGSELFPIRQEGFWTYCALPGGDEDAPLRGWVRTKDTERFWPWEPSLVE